jgi:hypothetical protein
MKFLNSFPNVSEYSDTNSEYLGSTGLGCSPLTMAALAQEIDECAEECSFSLKKVKVLQIHPDLNNFCVLQMLLQTCADVEELHYTLATEQTVLFLEHGEVYRSELCIKLGDLLADNSRTLERLHWTKSGPYEFGFNHFVTVLRRYL